MGLFDKIKDNAKTISMKAIEATREYDEDYEQDAVAADAAKISSPQTAAAAPTTSTEIETVEEQFIEEAAPAETPAKAEPAPKTEEEKPAKAETIRKSKVTEVPKAEHEKAEKEKRQEKAKQAAKERLAKSYVPSYKSAGAKKSEGGKEEKPAKAKTVKVTDAKAKKAVGIIDITPSKFQTPAKQAMYARERAAFTALASQRKLNGTVAIYTANHMNFKTRVFVDRIEYSGSFGKTVVPIEQVAWVKLRYGGTGVIIETVEGKRVVMVVKQADRLAFTDAVIKVQSMQPKKGKLKDTKTVRIDQLEKFGEGIDEIEKLAKLYDRGIITQEEFDAKKKKILGI